MKDEESIYDTRIEDGCFIATLIFIVAIPISAIVGIIYLLT